jgi:hypothetical protein
MIWARMYFSGKWHKWHAVRSLENRSLCGSAVFPRYVKAETSREQPEKVCSNFLRVAERRRKAVSA